MKKRKINPNSRKFFNYELRSNLKTEQITKLSKKQKEELGYYTYQARKEQLANCSEVRHVCPVCLCYMPCNCKKVK